MTKGYLRERLEKAKKKSNLDCKQLLWELEQTDIPHNLITELSLEFQVKDLIKEWNENEVKLDENFRRKQKKYLIGERKLDIFGKQFLIEDFDSINDYLKENNSNFFFFAYNAIIAGYLSKINGYNDIFSLDNALVSKPFQNAPIIVIYDKKYKKCVPTEKFTETIKEVISNFFNTIYFEKKWQRYKEEFQTQLKNRHEISSSKDIKYNIPEQLFFDFIDLFNAHENGHINTLNLYESYGYILYFDNPLIRNVNEHLAECVDGFYNKSTLGMIKETWKENPEKARYYLGLEIASRLFYNNNNPSSNEMLNSLLKIYNSEINIENFQDKLKERLLNITKDVSSNMKAYWKDENKINKEINKKVPYKLLRGLLI